MHLHLLPISDNLWLLIHPKFLIHLDLVVDMSHTPQKDFEDLEGP
jgi:hypothetical protein